MYRFIDIGLIYQKTFHPSSQKQDHESIRNLYKLVQCIILLSMNL